MWVRWGPRVWTPRYPRCVDLDAFATQYFADLAAARGTRAERLELEGRGGERPSDWLIDVIVLEPHRAEEAWPVIVHLIDVAPDDQGLMDVAAGPLEDALHYLPEQFGERILARARVDPKFNAALGGVWGWDRIPEPLRGLLLRVGDAKPPRPRTHRKRKR
jgi:hypothetical protein